MTLVDTSVWIDHFRRGNAELAALLTNGEVLLHPLVFGELACGGFRNRTGILQLLATLPNAEIATAEETMVFLEKQKLHGIGLGWIDISLLASARLTHCDLWTLDKTLAREARRLGLSD